MRIIVTISDLEYHEYYFFMDRDEIRFMSRKIWKRATKRHDHKLDKNVSWSTYSHDKCLGVKPELTQEIKDQVLASFKWS
jgi:hypothetical protein